jgi:hypothetical protein
MKEVTLSIGQLVNFIEKNYHKEFIDNRFTEVPFALNLQDQKDNWVPCTKIYQKRAPLYEIKFDNGAELKAADDHLLADLDGASKKVKDFNVGDWLFAYECISNEKISDDEVVYSPQIESESHIYKTTNGLMHHNTHEVMETCKKTMGQSPSHASYVYEAGDIGSSMSTLVPFFYKHSQNKIIVLDDNDKMLMNNLSQDIMNLIKALLDPKASKDKPITVRANMLQIFAKRLEDLEEEPLQEGVTVEIDAERLKEGVCRILVDDEEVVNSHISLKEAQTLSNMIRPERKIRERTSYKAAYEDAYDTDSLIRMYEAEKKQSNKEFLNDLIGGDEEEDEYSGMSEEDKREVKNMKDSGATEHGEEGKSFPRRFLFNSSVIFISNLELDQLNQAVLDRTETAEIKLTLDQFLQRLGNIYGGLCKGADWSQIPQDQRDWAKKCVYTALGIVIEAWKHRAIIWKTPVEINRKFTFRMFDEFVNAWLRYAMDRAQRVDGGDLTDKAYRDKVAPKLLPDIIRRKILPIIRQKMR